MMEKLDRIVEKVQQYKGEELEVVGGQASNETLRLKPRSEGYVRLPLFNDGGTTSPSI